MRSQAAAAGGGGCSGAMQETTLQPLSRQGSLYSLTLDEVQNQLGGCLGKPLGSMNLDELLKSVWTVEANQGSSMGIDTESTQSGTLAPLQKQPSFTLSRALSKKTVEEVWRDIQLGKSDNGDNHNERNEKRRKEDRDNGNPDRAPTLGEMTLEDFLYKAGVVTESPSMQKNDGQGHDLGVGLVNPGAPESAQWLMHFQLPSVQLPQSVVPVLVPGHHVVQQPVPVLASPFMDSPYGDAQMTVSPSSLLATSSDTQTPGGKRVARGDVVEKTVERRQKRMIKNRESAARSRARKQAYTHELENKVSRLEEENERLRRKLEAEKVLPSAPPAEPKNQLRRTSSSPI